MHEHVNVDVTMEVDDNVGTMREAAPIVTAGRAVKVGVKFMVDKAEVACMEACTPKQSFTA